MELGYELELELKVEITEFEGGTVVVDDAKGASTTSG
jgi:hypothetical protein